MLTLTGGATYTLTYATYILHTKVYLPTHAISQRGGGKALHLRKYVHVQISAFYESSAWHE